MCKTKGLVAGALLLTLVMIPAVSLACGAKPAQTTTYTDEANLFSISYPSDWKTALAQIEGLEQSTEEIASSLESGTPIEKTSYIFLAGRRTATGYEPNVIVAVEPIPAGTSTHDEIVEAEVQIAKEALPDYQVLSRVKTTVDGREATILDAEGTPPQSVPLHYVQMITTVDKTVWVVTCAALAEHFTRWENDFNNIVESLRILK
jgi:hypothetical protein